jgi:hypothetical protein
MGGHSLAVLLVTVVAAILIIRFWKAILLISLTLALAGALYGLIGTVEYLTRVTGR